MSIRSINSRDVNRITSGQVITDVRLVIKELVENGLDAGATLIEITVKNHGAEEVVVGDNGHGINPEDFETLCLRSHTLKIAEFGDLLTLALLGFRGEALHSMCTVAKSVAVTTVFGGFRYDLVYDPHGRLESQKKVPTRQSTGTTVTVHGLFANLPVRLKYLEKHSAAEFRKAMAFLNYYVVINPTVKFSVSHVTNTKRGLVLLARGGAKLTSMDAMESVFGKNGSQGLLPIEVEVSPEVKIEGHISDFLFGCGGRSSTDRQFLYVNKRPVSNKNVSKVINEVFRLFNNAQFPMYILNIAVQPDLVDVNLTPDKTKVLLNQEAALAELIRDALTEFYNNQRGIVIPKGEFGDVTQIYETDLTNGKPVKEDEPELVQVAESCESKRRRVHTLSEVRHFKEIDSVEEELEVAEEGAEDPAEEQANLAADDEAEYPEEDSRGLEEEREETDDEPNVSELERSSFVRVENLNDEVRRSDARLSLSMAHVPLQSTTIGDFEVTEIVLSPPANPLFVDEAVEESKDEHNSGIESEEDGILIEDASQVVEEVSSNPSHAVEMDVDETGVLTDEESPSALQTPASQLLQFKNDQTEPTDNYGVNFFPVSDNTAETTVSIGEHKDLWLPRQKTADSLHATKNDLDTLDWTFRDSPPKVSKLRSSKEAVPIVDDVTQQNSEGLARYIVSKSDFLRMKVIGQFNLGFILVRSPDDNVFIVDQHASDEKFNFERLTNLFVPTGQVLIQPLTVELSAIDEILVGEKMMTFRNNGFGITFNEENPPGKRVQLKSLPVLNYGVVYSVDDFLELLAAVSENPHNKNLKCSKVRRSLAMKACRTSIMIGESLSNNRMAEVVRNLAGLDKPWNCPHGRPTMRHLIEIAKWKENNFPDYV